EARPPRPRVPRPRADAQDGGTVAGRSPAPPPDRGLDPAPQGGPARPQDPAPHLPADRAPGHAAADRQPTEKLEDPPPGPAGRHPRRRARLRPHGRPPRGDQPAPRG